MPDGWFKFVAQIGIPSFFACVLLYFVLVRLGLRLDRLELELHAQTATLVEIQHALKMPLRNGRQQ